MKKIAALILVLVMAAAALTACSTLSSNKCRFFYAGSSIGSVCTIEPTTTASASPA